ncbi:LOW QUALITY PROTEIN: scale keratin-like [Dryobates pubescens]|uniref:LOW QUALITY PROTEIN: scale keratin-like n=1 Tax=Dryobates pubescens TaxID=118200 RepID=UPI0023B8EED7|nr:LOW QUALITY PROTEIN: scale keratin-like [Dryobates pubescens]
MAKVSVLRDEEDKATSEVSPEAPGPGQAPLLLSNGRAPIKALPVPLAAIHCSGHLLLGEQSVPSCRAASDPPKMSCYDLCPPKADLCPPKTSVAVPQPIAESCNELCARQCPDSTAFIQPPPVVVTFPGPILSSFPQQAVVGSSGAPAFGGSLGLGGLYGAGATQGSGGLCTFGRPYAAPACSPCLLPRYSRKLWDTCGPC